MSDLVTAALESDWAPPPGLLSKDEREDLDEVGRRTLARNRLGIYELRCPDCGAVSAVRNSTDGEVWLCPDCREEV